VMLVISGTQDRARLDLSLVVVDYLTHNIESMVSIVRDGDMPANDDGSLHVPFLMTSHSGRIVVVGGKNMLSFYGIRDVDGQLSLYHLKDMAARFPAHLECDATSVICLPPPKKSATMIDWIVYSTGDGELYGFSFELDEHGEVYMNDSDGRSGRFKKNKSQFSMNSPVTALVGCFGTESAAHHRAIRAQAALSYSRFLETLQYESAMFFALDDAGMMCTWSLDTRSGWVETQRDSLPALVFRSAPVFDDVGNNSMTFLTPSTSVAETVHNSDTGDNPSGQYGASCSSRLVPHIIVVVDKRRDLFLCIDRSRPDELSLPAVCSFA